ncbi:hypothetical protein [Haliangium sp.]|uniref:hypothetical protein n=1 Tax=Haliangium sp. TaxID=2663208 RepID=UPI003D106080
MHPLKRNAPHLTQALTVLALVGVCAWVIYQRHQPPSPMASKIASAERLSYQVVTRAHGPRFELLGDERVLKIVSHAVIDGGREYDPRRSVSYGLSLRLVDDGLVVWEHQALIESRQSKAKQQGSMWLEENAFTSRLDMELTDDRMMLVHLPAHVTTGSTLELRLVGEPEKALVRVYKRSPRADDAKWRALRRLDEAGGAVSFARSSYAPWALLDEQDKLRRVSHTFTRMAPVGEPRIDFDSESIFYSGFRLPVEDLEGDDGLTLRRHRGLALNVLGPSSLHLTVHRLDGDDAEAHAPRQAAAGDSDNDSDGGDGELRIRMISNDESNITVRALPVPPATQTALHTVDIPPGLHSLHLFTDARAPVRLDLSGPPMSQFGTMPYLAYDDSQRRLVPDERRLTVYETGPGKVPVQAGIFLPDDPRARILRVDVRVLVQPDPDGVADQPPLARQTFSTEVVLEYQDAQERVLAVERHTVEVPYAPFERLERTDGQVLAVSDSEGLRVVAPEGTQWVRVTTNADAAVRLYRFLAGPEAYQAPYDEVALEHARWRYAPRDRRQWFHSAPVNTPLLLEAQQRSALVAQVRLVPERKRSPKKRRGPPPPAVAVKPLGRPEQHRILEKVPPARVPRLLQEWPADAATELVVGRPTRFRFGGQGRGVLDFTASDELLGRFLTVHVDGQPKARFRFTTASGRWRLPQLDDGVHEITAQVEADADGAAPNPSTLALYLDRPPAITGRERLPRATLVRRRTVYAVGVTPLRIEVRKPPGKHVRVTMVVYAPWPEAREDVSVHAVIGGGVPARVTRRSFPRITVAERTMTLPDARTWQSAVFADLRGQSVGHPRFVTVPLGRDLVPGSHRIQFSVPGGPLLWARFFVTHQPSEIQDQALQWRFDADVDDAPLVGAGDAEDESAHDEASGQ